MGVLLDSDVSEMHYYRNGIYLGLAFTNFPHKSPMYPAVSLNAGQSIHFNFGDVVPFKHAPTNFKGRKLQLVGASSPYSTTSTSHEINHHHPHHTNDQEPSNETQEDDEDHVEEQVSEVETGRNRMSDNLINMGFPVEWVLRCSQTVPSTIDETGAIAWIIEAMEQEAYALGEASFSDTLSGLIESSFDPFGIKDNELNPMSSSPKNNSNEMKKTIGTSTLLGESCDHVFDVSYFPKPPTLTDPPLIATLLSSSITEDEIALVLVTVETALVVLYSREIVTNVLQHLSKDNEEEVIDLSHEIGKLLEEEKCFKHLIAFSKLVLYRNPSVLSRSRHSTALAHPMCTLWKSNRNLLQYTWMKEVALHFTEASDINYCNTRWGSDDKVSGNVSDGELLKMPNLDWAQWIVEALVQMAREDLQPSSSLSVPPIGYLDCSILPTLFDNVFSSTNMITRHFAFSAATNCLSVILEDLLISDDDDSTDVTTRIHQLYNVNYQDLPGLFPIPKLADLLAKRQERETLNRLVLSSYIQVNTLTLF